jgi:hypothetical protein
MAEVVSLGVAQGGRIGYMPVGAEVYFYRPAGSGGYERGPVPSLPHDAHLVTLFCGEYIGEQVAPGAFSVMVRRVEYALGAWGDKRVGVDLPVRVVQRHTDVRAAVFEAERLLHMG